MRKILCTVVTFGRHWWVYGVRPVGPFRSPQVYCKICHHQPNNQWEIYEKKFLGKLKGKYTYQK